MRESVAPPGTVSAGGRIINLQALTDKRGEKETKSGFSLENNELMLFLRGPEVETDLEMGRQWWRQAGVVKNGRERGKRPVWRFFNVAFVKNPQLSGQRETSMFLKLRIQHEVIVLRGQREDKQS